MSRTTIASTLERFRADAVSSFAGVAFDDASVTACFTPILAGLGGDAQATLERLHGADLLLAHRCATGDPRALAAFERAFFGEARAVLQRRTSAQEHEEVLQQLREKLFVGRRLIASYTGKGSLRSWLRIALVRTAMNVATRASDDILVDEIDAFEQRGTFDAELSALKRIYREAFRRSFRRAAQALTDRERALLRLSAVDRLSVDRIAAVYSTHRATAARWLNLARERLRDGIHADLAVTLGVDSRELASVLALIHSNVAISADALL